jgi:hypothetical protein
MLMNGGLLLTSMMHSVSAHHVHGPSTTGPVSLQLIRLCVHGKYRERGNGHWQVIDIHTEKTFDDG